MAVEKPNLVTEALQRQAAAKARPREQWLTRDQLEGMVKRLYPALQPGRDYWIGHIVNPATGEQESDAFIATWHSSTPEPDMDALKAQWSAHADAVNLDVAARQVRMQRDALLSQADVLLAKAQDAGNPAAEAAVRAYRKALRDVPQQTGFPVSVQWPTAPTV